MQQLQELADERAEGERSTEETRESELAAAQEQRDSRTDALVKECTQRRRDLENEFSTANRDADQRLRDTTIERRTHHKRHAKRVEDYSKQIILAIERRKKESEWQALAVFRRRQRLARAEACRNDSHGWKLAWAKSRVSSATRTR